MVSIMGVPEHPEMRRLGRSTYQGEVKMDHSRMFIGWYRYDVVFLESVNDFLGLGCVFFFGDFLLCTIITMKPPSGRICVLFFFKAS